MATAVTTRRKTWRTAAAVLTAAGLVVAACSADDAVEADPTDPPLEAPADVEGPAPDDAPAEAPDGSAVAGAWTAAADEVRTAMSAHGFAAEEFSQARDEAVRAGMELLPAGMPAPDLESSPTAGVAPTAPHCLGEFAITVGLYHAPDRPYTFDEATDWFETGISEAGWSAQTEDLIGPDHPFAGDAQGVGYTVQTDDGPWYVSIMAHLGTDLAYCPVG